MVKVCEIKRGMKDAYFLERKQPICKHRVTAFYRSIHAHLELATDTDKGQLLGVDTLGGCGSLWEEFLDEGVFANDHKLLQAGMKSIIVLVQETNLQCAVKLRSMPRTNTNITHVHNMGKPWDSPPPEFSRVDNYFLILSSLLVATCKLQPFGTTEATTKHPQNI